jgi:hypothetical protein
VFWPAAAAVADKCNAIADARTTTAESERHERGREGRPPGAIVPWSAARRENLSLRRGGRIGPTLDAGADRDIRAGRLPAVLEEREAMVLEVRPWTVHGSPFLDVTLVYPDRSVETARLGAESAPADLAAGERVTVRTVMQTIVEVSR